MAGGLPHPVLLSDLVGLGYINVGGQTVEFKHVFYTWVIMALMFAVAFLVRGKIKMVPGKLQNIFEVIIGGLEDFVVGITGEDGRKVYPMLIVFFLFILCLNLSGLVPGFDAPTANINTTAALALVCFIYYNYIGIQRWGAGYIKHFMGPMWWLSPLMLPLELISHTARPLSLTLRLFGNIRGEEIVLVLFFMLAPLVGTIPIYFLFSLAKVLQAFIFFMLATIYLKGSLEHAH